MDTVANLERFVQELNYIDAMAQDPATTLDRTKEALSHLFKREAALKQLAHGPNSALVYEILRRIGATQNSLVELASAKVPISKAYTKVEIPPTEVFYDQVRDCRGAGAFARVYKATCRGKIVAVKVPTLQSLTEGQVALFRHEIELYSSIMSPNVVQFHGACTQQGHLFIVTELMSGNLEDFMISQDFPKVPLYERLCMALDIALGLNWLHGICHIIHRDLKPANLLLDSMTVRDPTPSTMFTETSRKVKISDFGFSQVVPQGAQLVDKSGAKGSYLYMAPEVMCLEQFDSKSDVYSFGVILWELLTGQEPYLEAGDDVNTLYTIVCVNHLRPSCAGLPASISKLLGDCWNHSPALRPPFESIKDSLEDAIIDAGLDSRSETPNVASTWWKHYFSRPLKLCVDTADFQAAISASVPSHRESLELNGLFRGPNSDVTLRRFKYLCMWFGPFFHPDQGAALLAEMRQLVQTSWFHFDVFDSTRADARLRNRKPGTFLVRPSVNAEASVRPFTLSYLDSKASPVHVRISRPSYDVNLAERYFLGEDKHYRARTLPELVASVRALQFPCPPNEISAYDATGYSYQGPAI